MSDQATSKSIYNILRRYLRNRPDLGLGKSVRAAVLEPLNPFDSKAPRAPRRWLVLFALLAGTLGACFAYFNHLI